MIIDGNTISNNIVGPESCETMLKNTDWAAQHGSVLVLSTMSTLTICCRV